jgi:hypothetical protein
VLTSADAGTRQRLATNLQRQCGNAAVQRLLAPAPVQRQAEGASSLGPAVQRWAVGLNQGEANCLTVANYVNQNTPYKNAGGAPGWARTKADFSWSGAAVFSTSGATITATLPSPSVSKSVAVDMPVWSPTDAVMKKAWGTAMGELRTHEAKHEAVATTWESTLKANLAGLSVTVSKQTEAAVRAAVKPSWDGWIAQHQADQIALDPFGVTVDCAAAEGDSASGEGATGETAPADAAAAEVASGETAPAEAASGETATAGDASGETAAAESSTGDEEASSPTAVAEAEEADDERDEAA